MSAQRCSAEDLQRGGVDVILEPRPPSYHQIPVHSVLMVLGQLGQGFSGRVLPGLNMLAVAPDLVIEVFFGPE